MNFDLKKYFEDKKALVDENLREKWTSPVTMDPVQLHESMHYSLFAPGKRIRPILVLATAEALGIPNEDVMPIAACLEMIHVFSLIHDDLPAMDDDDYRRGQLTNHKVFGEAKAILAGDALLANAFIPLTNLDDKKYKAENILKLIRKIAEATGTKGMVAGQVIDLESEGKKISLERLKILHQHKTGALIRIAVEAPAILAGIADPLMSRLVIYGNAIGLAFQIADDILDIEGGEELGKDIGSDVDNQKATYPSLLGLDGAKKEALCVLDAALDSLKAFDERANPLREIAKFIVYRKK